MCRFFLIFSFLYFFSFFQINAQDSKQYSAILKVKDSSVDVSLKNKGILIQSIIGNIRTVLIPENSLNDLSSIPGILGIQISNQMNALRIKNDLERDLTKVNELQDGNIPGLPQNLIYDGSGVIVGIVDLGFQCNNPNFYSAKTGRTRIKRYWQQNNNNGMSPIGYSYGTEYSDTTEIQQLNDFDGTHGTHVAGIAAGSGLSSPNLMFRGVATEADLVFVSIKYSNDTLLGSALGDYIVANPTIIDAYKYIFDYAESVGKPAVINLSWGMHTGPHDGSSLFDQATELLVGNGKVLVGANGNEGDNAMHLYHQFNHDTIGSIMIENSRQFRTRESVYSDFWGSPKSSFSIKIQFVDTFMNVMAETPFISSNSNVNQTFNFKNDTNDFSVSFLCQSENSENLKPNITVMAEHSSQQNFAIFTYISSDTSEIHGWNSGAARAWTSGSFTNNLNKWQMQSSFMSGNTQYTAGENGGSSKAVLSVGAIAARSSFLNVKGKWVNDSNYVVPPELAKFSSRGPTVDGRIKPNITAPGYDVPSSINNKQLAPWMLDKTLHISVYKNDTQYWMASNGTSMAAPHVTGIVALMLQANPFLNYKDVIDIIQQTADRESYMGNIPNNNYGYGRINALNAVTSGYHYYGISENNKKNRLEVYPNPITDKVRVVIPISFNDCDIEIIDIQGQQVQSYIIEHDGTAELEIDLSKLIGGVYFLKINVGGEIYTAKLIKNH